MERLAPFHPYEKRMSSIEMTEIQTMTESVKNLSMSPKMGSAWLARLRTAST